MPLERAEGLQVALRLGDPFDGSGAVGADQLILEVLDADEEPQLLHVTAGEVRAQARVLETAPEVVFLLHVAEARQLEFLAAGAVQLEVAPDRLGASHRHDGNSFRFEVASLPLGERLDRVSVADSLDEDHRSGLEFHMLHS